MQKEKRKIQITDAKVRGFWADSKKLARLLVELLRQGRYLRQNMGKSLNCVVKGIKKARRCEPKLLTLNLIL